MLRNVLHIVLLTIATGGLSLAWGQTVAFKGTVLDGQTRGTLDYATVRLFVGQQLAYGGITNANGRFELLQIKPGNYRIDISYLGYESFEQDIKIPGGAPDTFYLKPSNKALNEVVVTASESKRATSTSVIDRTAMRHLQPSSFSDLLELVPGGKASDPQMDQANLIHLREAGTTENISSLGVSFFVDGIAQNTDANLQYIPGSTSAVNETSTVNKGLDMRTISTDNIEKVEIIRGIPSVAYGNVSSGAVLIERKASETPFTARFKADKTSKLFSAGKGFRLDGHGHYILNADLNYLDSKIDPRNSVKNYTRVTGSARLDAKSLWRERTIHWNISTDYTGSFDKAKRDKDATAKEDAYKSDYNSFKLAGKWNMKFPSGSWMREINASASINQQWEKMSETKSVSLNRPAAITTQKETGESDGLYLPYNYVAQMVIDGKPLY
ncbi:MAG: TonB-dependent receptor, partial [Bacteroidales bacterium]|nr:TonB-dependent receptor [Bacteroidales bacterium]